MLSVEFSEPPPRLHSGCFLHNDLPPPSARGSYPHRLFSCVVLNALCLALPNCVRQNFHLGRCPCRKLCIVPSNPLLHCICLYKRADGLLPLHHKHNCTKNPRLVKTYPPSSASVGHHIKALLPMPTATDTFGDYTHLRSHFDVTPTSRSTCGCGHRRTCARTLRLASPAHLHTYTHAPSAFALHPPTSSARAIRSLDPPAWWYHILRAGARSATRQPTTALGGCTRSSPMVRARTRSFRMFVQSIRRSNAREYQVSRDRAAPALRWRKHPQ
jgi:hypothetical protein